jgi:hypothetical protein
MKTKLTTTAIERYSTPVFFIFLFLYQFFFTLTGIDFLDEGFSATFYQQFYNDPWSVEYNFLYWLSGLVGGTWYKLFPGTGLLGLRFLAIICTMSTIFMVYNLLKNYINKNHLKIGLALVTFAVCWNPKIFHYNFLSIVLYTGAASLLFNGLKKQNWIYLFFAGSLVALDAFARIPSILNLGLVVAIAFYGFLEKKSFWHIFKQSFVFVIGFVFALGAVLLLMKAMGHLEVYQGALRIVFNMGQSGDVSESEYGIVKLFMQFLGSYETAVIFTLYILALIVLAAVAPKYVKENFKLPGWLITVGKVACLVLAALIILKGLEILIRFYVGLTLITAFLILTTKNTKEIKTLMLIGTYISLTYALGSSAGIFTAGVHIFWIALPIGIDFILNIKNFYSKVSLGYKPGTSYSTDLVINDGQFRNIKLYIVAISLLGCFVHQWFYPLHDESNRIKMLYQVKNKYVRGIFTIKERADAVNELLRQSAPYVKPGDYVLAFHSLPIYHFMTDTKPFAGNPMPWYYQSAAFKLQLYKAVDRTKTLPVVVMHKIKITPNDHGDWPDPWPSDPIFLTPEKDPKAGRQEAIMDEFLNKYAYKVVWENNIFKILTPGVKLDNNNTRIL